MRDDRQLFRRLGRIRRRCANLVRETASMPDKRSSLARWLAFVAIGRFSPIVAVDKGGFRYFVSTRDQSVGRLVFITGDFEPDVLDDAITIVEREHGPVPLLANRVFVDVGANIGTSAIPAVRRHGAKQAIAFEPERCNYELLRMNIVANRVEEEVCAAHLALSDRPGKALLEMSPSNSGDHRLRMRGETGDGLYGEGARPTTPIDVARFDDALLAHSVDLTDVGLVWIDTQGHEGHVLAGAPQLLASDIPVVIEYWPYGLRRANGLDLLHELVAKHYSRVIDIRETRISGRIIEVPPTEVSSLASLYNNERHTDLVLLP